MAKTPNVALRFDPELYAAYKLVVEKRGQTVTGSFEQHMSRETGLPISRPNRDASRTMQVTCPFCDAVPGEKCRDGRIPTELKHVKRPHPQRIRRAQELAEVDA